MPRDYQKKNLWRNARRASILNGVDESAKITLRFETWCDVLRRRANKSGIPFSITRHDLAFMWHNQKQNCAITGIKFAALNRRNQTVDWNSPTIDRIIPSLGYVSGNIRMILHCVNEFKGLMTDQQMAEVAYRIHTVITYVEKKLRAAE